MAQPETAWQLGPFEKLDACNPILTPRAEPLFSCPLAGPLHWEAKDVFNPAAIVRDGQVCLIYRAEDTVGRWLGTSRLGLATSADGLHFTRRSTPVLYPDNDDWTGYEWEGGCEDPRIVQDATGRYVLTYTAWDGACARLCVASSRDLVTWRKHGLAFGARYRDTWSKSGAIVCRLQGEQLIAAEINGSYWMYWGEGDIALARSPDLINWTPVTAVLGANKHMSLLDGRYIAAHSGGALVPLPVMRTRVGRFDSALVEPGPPPLLTDAGIVLIYNACNDAETGDARLPAGTYAAGQALFDTGDPSTLIARCHAPFLVPDRAYERHGQLANVCFAQGLVRFGGRWQLYYGSADSQIAVAATVDPS